MSDVPLLRSPPFPWAARSVAAVSGAVTHSVEVPDDAEVDALLAAIRDARVGAEFWAEPARTESETIARPRTIDDVRRVIGTLPGPALWSTERRSAPRPPPGSESVRGAVDPWSLLAPGRTLVAHGDDEWAAIATIAGAELRLLSPGRFARPDEDVPARRRRIATGLLAATYRDPFTGVAASIDATIALLALWRSLIAANRPIAAAAGMAWWKRAEMRRFLWAPRAASLRFLPGALAVRLAASRGGDVAVWPSRISARTVRVAARRGVRLVEVEDGFIRSVGLGADLVPPLSVAVDRLGVHYDPSRPSELESLLENTQASPALLARAAALRDTIVARGISKYGLAAGDDVPPRDAGRRLVLVPGQVEDDRSVLLGGGEVAGNLDLLRRARDAEPDAEIWYRPHPDVDAGHRRGGVRDAEALRHVDRVVRGGGMAALLATVDAVHVLTSLTGFEALLRGLDVTCHGVPFYAGWGLTRDLARVPERRRRRLTLDELVAATLIRYPRYLDPVTGLPCPVETLVARLAGQSTPPRGALIRMRRWQGRLSKGLRRLSARRRRS